VVEKNPDMDDYVTFLYLKADTSEAENTQQLIDFNNKMSHT